MRKIRLEDLKKIELNMLRFIDATCQKEKLRYYLCGGTLLGAVRHQGFIPWDDDIDIFMPRPDYEKMIRLVQKTNEYRILSDEDEGYYYNFAKLIDTRTIMTEEGNEQIKEFGVYIDIFPLDGMPNDKAERMRQFRRLDKSRCRITSFSNGRPHFRKNIFILMYNWFYYITNRVTSIEHEQKKYKDIAKRYSYDDSIYVYATGGAYKKKDIFPREWLQEKSEMLFEGVRFQVPAEYDKYLRQLYGNYMELPPVEKRVSHHHFVAYYIDQ